MVCLKHLLVSASLVFVSTPSFAKELWDLPLDELVNMKVVSATRKEASALQLPSIVTVITGEELSQFGAENLADGLRTVAAIQVRQGPGDFPSYELTVRGNTADFMNLRTLFLIDGIPIRNPNAGFDPSWLPISMIHRVEIVKGPASNLYGANAFGGLVNVITKTAEKDQGLQGAARIGGKTQRDVLENTALYGKAGLLNIGNGEGKLRYFASAQYADTQASPRTTAGHQYQDVFGKLNYDVSETFTVNATALMSQDRNQIAVTNTDSPIKNDVFRATTTATLKPNANTELSVTGHVTTFGHFLDYTDPTEHYDNTGRVYGLNSLLSTSFEEDHSILMGIEYTEEFGRLDTKSYNYSSFPPILEPAGWEEKRQNNYGLYTQYSYTGWEKFLPILGIRYDHHSGFGSAVSPRVGISYLNDENSTFYVSVGRGFRAPVFNETAILGFGKVGNPSLTPEYSMTYEIGAKTAYANTQNNFALFKEDISEKIELVNISSSQKSYRNGGTGSIYGFEFDGWFKFLPKWRLFYNTTILRSDDGAGNRIERLIETLANLGLDWTSDSWSARLIGAYASEQYFYNTNNSIPSDSQGRVHVPSVLIGNFQISKRFSEKLSGTLYINNIADRKYQEQFTAFIQQDGLYLPGRMIGARLSAQF